MSWEVTKIGKVLKVSSGGTPSRKKPKYFQNGTIPWIKTGDLKGMYLSNCKELITEDAIKDSSAKIFPVNTVLLAMYGATIGACSILPFEAATNQACAALLPSDVCNPEFLYYYLKSIKEELINKGVGGAQPNISGTIIKDTEIPLPPLETQKKIATILDQADALIQNDKKILEKYDQLAQSVFMEMFGDPVTNQRGWDLCTIRDLVSEVKYGTSSKAIEGGQYPYLRMNNITYGGYWDFSKLKYIDLNEKEIPKYLVKRGDILFNRTNSKELVGKTAVYDLDDEMVIAGYLIRVRVNENANPYFIWGYLNSRHGKMVLENMCKNIVGMANINAQELQDIKLLKPSLEPQNKFEITIKEIGKQKQLTQQSLKKSEELFQSLLQRAFQGELV